MAPESLFRIWSRARKPNHGLPPHFSSHHYLFHLSYRLKFHFTGTKVLLTQTFWKSCTSSAPYAKYKFPPCYFWQGFNISENGKLNLWLEKFSVTPRGKPLPHAFSCGPLWWLQISLHLYQKNFLSWLSMVISSVVCHIPASVTSGCCLFILF